MSLMRRAVVWAFAVVLTAIAGPLDASASEVSRFVSDSTVALSMVRRARDQSTEIDGSPVSDMAWRFAILDLQEAKKRLAPHRLSHTAAVQMAAAGLTDALDRVARRYEDAIRLNDAVAKLRREPYVDPDVAQALQGRVTAWSGALALAWDDVLPATVAVTYAMVEYPGHAPEPRLCLSVQERESLADEIDALFPDAREGLRDGQSPIVSAAALIRHTLSDYPPQRPAQMPL